MSRHTWEYLPTSTPKATTEHGQYVDLKRTDDGNLEIVLSEEGRRDFAEIEQIREDLGSDAALAELLEDHLGNGWEILLPEEIGALTSAPILSHEVARDQEGKVEDVGIVYWYPEYQVRDEIEELREKHVVLFRGVGPASS
jgi:hypothetical protein